MPTVKLTDAAVQRLKAPPGGRVDYFDAAYPGLALRVTGAVDQRPERRTWTLFYRFGGKQRRMTFEPGYPALGLAERSRRCQQGQIGDPSRCRSWGRQSRSEGRGRTGAGHDCQRGGSVHPPGPGGKEAGAAIHCRDAAHFRQSRVAALGRPRHRDDHPPRRDRTARRGDG